MPGKIVLFLKSKHAIINELVILQVKECSGTWHIMIDRVVLEWSLGLECSEIWWGFFS